MKKGIRKISLILSLLMIVSAFLTACGSNPNNSNANSGNSDSDSGNTASAKDTLVYVVEDDLVNWNCNAKMYQVEMLIMPMLTDTLALDMGNGEYKPLLAESWEVSEDGLTWTFHLRKGVKFHNGEDFTAEDMVFTCENGREYPNQVSDMVTMESFEAVDDYTFVVHMNQVDAGAERALLTYFGAIPKDYYEEVGEIGFNENPVGTGPFKFGSRNVGTDITMVRNDEYWGDKPALREVTFTIINDITTASAALAAGQVDMMRLTNASTINVIKSNPDLAILNVPSNNINYCMVNPNVAPFDNIKVRQAVNYALNREAMVEVLAGGYGNGHSVLCPKGVFGYSDDVTPQYEYDVEKAKELIEESGITVPMDVGKIVTFPSSAPAAQMVQYDLAQIGLNLEIQQYDLSVAMQTMAAGDFTVGMWDCGTGAELCDIDWVLRSDGLCNYAGMKDVGIDELLDKAMGTLDNAERGEYYKEVLDIVNEECKYFMLYDNDILYAKNANLVTPHYPNGKMLISEISWE